MNKFDQIAALFVSRIIEIPNFPKPPVLFRDITPVLQDPVLCASIVEVMTERIKEEIANIEAIAGIESRGFLFGVPLATALGVPFIPIRKEGKLPREQYTQAYALEYGKSTVHMHKDAVRVGQRVLIHDDVLATGGTVEAVAGLLVQAHAQVAGFNFLIQLEDFLGGADVCRKHSTKIISLCRYGG